MYSRLAVSSLVLIVAACGGGSPNNPTTPSTSSTYQLRGQVTSTAGGGIGGATVRIGDGPNANRSATTDAAGGYSLDALTPSGFTLTISAPTFTGASVSVTLTGNQVVNVSLAPAGRPFLPLEFPFVDPRVVVRMASWGIPNWSGSDPHNGIDLVVDDRLASTTIISPTAGEVRSVSATENPFSNPAGQLIVTIAINVNAEWTVDLALEPGTADPQVKAAQMAAVRVQPGQIVNVGTPVADLVVGRLGYPHLHFMVERGMTTVCAYAYSSDAARRIFETISTYANGNVPGGQICVGR